jgi:hypothetical protein
MEALLRGRWYHCSYDTLTANEGGAMGLSGLGQTSFDFAGARLVVTDLDDTLLRSDKTISARTHAAIAGAQAAGVVFAIATARPPRTMVPSSMI